MQATVSYVADNDQILPFPNFLSQQPSNNDIPTNPGWLYQPPVLNPGVEGQVETGTLWPYLKNRSVYRCPIDDTPSAFGPAHAMTSYVMNGAVCGYALSFTPSQKYTRFRQDGVCFWESGDGENGGVNSTTWDDGSAYPTVGLTSRHRHGGCMVSFDTHAEWMSDSTFSSLASPSATTPNRLWCDPATATGQ
jgi:hypothetical protein